MANEVAKTANKKDKKPNLFARIGRFFKDVVGELKKLTWPTGKELAKYTATVLAFIVLFAVVIGVLDFLFGQGFTLLGSLAGKSGDSTALADAFLGMI
ncbi:MAG: preprotein translocase subunit SecE [Eubacteriales bacterium]|jgi:preprotein translocase subunit SecE|nr:preprotein translocase subunit SecE [Eubacteriales bacterium]MCI6979838.1 preprotein translocase subunit SecE [Clostridiales bacterium]MDD6720866.1 preprotein translocase subunit SecE [Clostridiales bacterium]MDY5694170.1 preprotein translocase subunit SecE [Eubacteriales bacterium]HZK44790.1 preprotein translocase subunit SecE [Clostridia bacterium]